MPGLTLIHIVSEQEVQNLLPALALQPEKIIQVHSPAEEWKNRAKNLKKAIQASGVRSDVQREEFPQKACTVEDYRAFFKRLFGEHPRCVINYTGGTKPMAIAAYMAARECGSIATIYCDTANRQFHCEPSHADFPVPTDKLDFEKAVESLSLKTLLMANRGTDEIKSQTPSPEQKEFARKVFNLFLENLPLFNKHSKGWDTIRRNFQSDKTGEFADLSDETRQVLEMAASYGFVSKTQNGGFTFSDPDNPSRRTAEKNFKFVEGQWLEVAIYDLMESAGRRFRDITWSLLPSPNEGGEMDIVAIDTKKAGLIAISAKANLPTVEHVESHLTRTRQQGGSHASVVICSLCPQSQEIDKEKRREFARSLGIDLRFWHEIPQFFRAKPL